MEHPEPSEHPQAHAVVRRKSALPPLAIEIGVAVTAGWTVYASTNDWQAGVGVMLATLFGGLMQRGSAWYMKR